MPLKRTCPRKRSTARPWSRARAFHALSLSHLAETIYVSTLERVHIHDIVRHAHENFDIATLAKLGLLFTLSANQIAIYRSCDQVRRQGSDRLTR